MHILHICSVREIGGGERHISDLSVALSNRGHDLYFALHRKSMLRADLGMFPKSRFCSSSRYNVFRIAAFAKANSVDVIHAHSARDYTTAATVSRLTGIPYVLTRHVLFRMKRVNRLLLRRVAGVIAPSAAIQASLNRDGIFSREKITPIRYGIDPGRFATALRPAHNPFTIGSVGHLSPIKGYDTLISSALILKDAHPDLGFRLLIVGEDKAKDGCNRRELEELTEANRLRYVVEFAGWNDDVRAALSGMDIFVSAARSEAFGLAIVEAMMAGLPVIATRSEGASEILEDGVTGLLVPIDQPQEMADALWRLMDDENLRSRLGKAGQGFAVSIFTRDRMAEQTESFYRNVLRTP
ncbi:MAG TPA: glycosyltransferase family 4 protein [Pyrinomonadaceae bacterium]